MFIVNNRKFFFILSALLVAGSVLAIVVYGFNLGIDFKGGSILEVSYAGPRPSLELTREALDKLNLGTYILIPSGDNSYTIKMRDITPEEKGKIMQWLPASVPSSPVSNGNGSSSQNYISPKEEKFSSIGPIVGTELKNKAMIAIGIVILCIVLFITFAFRKVSRPVASWKYGLATIIALAHDVIIPTGIFVTWIHYRGGEIDLLFVTALLAILGYSVHDTIVVFDRVRENLRNDNGKTPFLEVVGRSVTQTFGRSINTSLTIFLALVALYLIGGETTRDFAFVLLVGVIAGTYSSIFVASPLLVTLEKLQKNN